MDSCKTNVFVHYAILWWVCHEIQFIVFFPPLLLFFISVLDEQICEKYEMNAFQSLLVALLVNN